MTLFSITVSTEMPVGRSAATASSVSVTGMSSSRVTRCTAVVVSEACA